MAHLLEPFAGDRAHDAAVRLIAHFGSLGRALDASSGQLAAALGRDDDLVGAIVAARALIKAGLREQVARTQVSIHDPRFRDYLRSLIAKSPTECLHATFVAQDWGYLADELLARGGTGHVEGDLRRLLGRAFDVGAQGVVLAHNHPSGSAEPSAEDIRLTRRIADLTQAVGVQLLDHLILAGADMVSMRERGLL